MRVHVDLSTNKATHKIPLERRIKSCVCAPCYPHTFMGGDDSRLFRADENSQTGTSFPEAGTSYPESGTSLQRVVLHRVTHATCAAICKEDSGGISYCEHSLSSCLSSLLVLCECAPRYPHTQNDGSDSDARHMRRTQNHSHWQTQQQLEGAHKRRNPGSRTNHDPRDATESMRGPMSRPFTASRVSRRLDRTAYASPPFLPRYFVSNPGGENAQRTRRSSLPLFISW